MLIDILNLITNSAEQAFLAVGVFVGIALLVFGLINYKSNNNLVKKIESSKKYQPIIGALLGMTPGCGGAILVMPLFLKGSVSYGTVIATLIATMGDAAFVMIVSRPVDYLLISVISFIVAIITGYVIDYYNVGEKLFGKRAIKSKEELIEEHEKFKGIPTEYEMSLCVSGHCSTPKTIHIGHEEGDEIDLALHHQINYNSLLYKFRHRIGYKIFWLFNSIGIILGILLLFQIDINTDLFIPSLGLIGVAGTFFSIIYMIIAKKNIASDTHDVVESKMFSLKETLIHNAEETAFVITWVFVALLVYEFGIYLVGGEVVVESWLKSTGFIAIIIGGIVGLIPGCGPQIIFATLYVNGLVPFAALLANAISQDGDALFPLLAIDRKTSVWATLITTVPAIIFGIIIYLIELLI